ncbi:hypothetical protein EUA34_09375 [Neisseria meningitidis]|nr:hypothetical protein EUA34_09375 [Neisseria meningitidis]
MSGNDEFQDYGVVGTQLNRHSHESGNLESRGFSQLFLSDKFLCGQVRIPACAGMTAEGCLSRFTWLKKNDFH